MAGNPLINSPRRAARRCRRVAAVAPVGLWLAFLPSFIGVSTAGAQELRSRILPAEGLDAESAALLLSQEDGGDLPLRATLFVTDDAGSPASAASAEDTSDSTAMLTVLLEMNRTDVGLGPQPVTESAPSEAELVADGARVDVFLYQLDGDLGVVGAHIRVVQIERVAGVPAPAGLPSMRSEAADTGDGVPSSDQRVQQTAAGRLRYLTQVPLDPDAAEVRVLVRARSTGRSALRRRPVEPATRWPVLPVVSQRPLAVVTDGAFPSSVIDWARSSALLLGLAESSPSGPEGNPDRSLDEPDERVGDAVAQESGRRDPVLEAAVRVASGGPSGLVAEVWAGEEMLWTEPFAVEPGAREAEQGWVRVPLAPPFVDFGPGRYQLVLRRADEMSGRRPLAHEVLVRSDVDAAATLFAGAGRRLAIPARELVEGMRLALKTLVDGDAKNAVRQLTAVERRAIAGSGERVEAARGAQVRAIARFAKAPELLLPAIDLYLRAYRDRRAAQEYLLTTHAREMSLALLDRYLRSDGMDPAVAAAFLAALAKARSPGPSDASVPLLEWAVELDEGAIDALWLRAVIAEAGADVEEASRWWRLAVEQSEDREARLHLGVTLLRREGRRVRREARALLEDLGTQDDWIGEAARSELAREALRRGQLSEAARRLGAVDREADSSRQVLRSYLAFVSGEDHEMRTYGDAGHRGQSEVPARRRYATAWQRRAVEWTAPESAMTRAQDRLGESWR